MHDAQVAKYLFDAEAVKVSIDPPFTWTSGIKSPMYCDNRKLISHVEARDFVVKHFIEKMRDKGLDPDFIAGTATAAIPWAAFVAQALELPMVYIRPEKKEHGAGKHIEGDLPPGKNVLLIEDLVSTGGSSLKAVGALRNEGKCMCDDIFAIVTYGFAEAEKAMVNVGVTLSTLTDFATILRVAQEENLLTVEDAAKALEFAVDPRGWI